MAKRQTTDRPDDTKSPEELRAELIADLGLDELTYESCVRELFEELISSPTDDTARREPTRVVQAGPPRRG